MQLYKVKVKLSLCLTKHHAMQTYRGSGGIAPYILDFGNKSLIFFLTVCFKLIHLFLDIVSFCSWQFYWFHISHCSGYLYLFDLDSAVIAI